MRLRWLPSPVKCLEATSQRCWRPADSDDSDQNFGHWMGMEICKGGEGSSLGYCLGVDFSSYVFASDTLNSVGFFLWIAHDRRVEFLDLDPILATKWCYSYRFRFFFPTYHPPHPPGLGRSQWLWRRTLGWSHRQTCHGGLRWPDRVGSQPTQAIEASQKTDLQRLWLWIYGGFMVDLPIEHDDFMGFWYGILVWVTLWLWLTGLAMVKPWPIDEIDGPNPVLSMVVIFHGEVLVITRWYIKKETSKIFTRKLWILDILDLCCLYKTMVNTHG